VESLKSVFLILAATCVWGFSLSAKAAKISSSISDQGDTIHLEFAGQQNWEYDLSPIEKSGKKFLQLNVDPIDDASIAKLIAFKSDLVKGITVDKSGPDGKYVVNFEVSGDNTESFDYLTDQPSRLIVDFYAKTQAKDADKTAKVTGDGKASTKNPSSKPAKSSVKNKTSAIASAKAGKDRKPATADALVIANNGLPPNAEVAPGLRSGLFDGGDPSFERFSIKDYEVRDDALIRAKEKYYIPYPMIQADNHYWERMKTAAPIYEVTPKDTDENKEARLLQNLFEKKRYGVYLKTEEWFSKKYPESQYGEIIDFMTADVYKNLWQEKDDAKFYEIAQIKYKQAMKKHPKSALLERTSMMLGNLALEKGDAIEAMRIFNEHIDKNYAGSPGAISNDLARLGISVAFAKLNRFEEAAGILNKLKKESAFPEIKAEAAYRLGDVFVKGKNYQRAIDAYKQAIKEFPGSQAEYPNAFYNQAEALFGLGEYRKSMDVYLDFIKKFPSHEHAAFAMTRMGELLDILGADKSRVVGAYLETYFRYGESNNAIIARLRLTSARMKAMKPKEAEIATKEILELVKKLDIPNIQQFGTIMIAEGFAARSENEKAIDLLTKYYQQNPTSVDAELFKNRIIGNITAEIAGQLKDGKFITALKTHSKYADNWLKNSDRMDTKFYLGRAFEMAGAPEEASTHYRDVLNQTYAIKGTKKEKELAVNHQKPDEDELNLRLASTAYQQKKFNQAYDFLKNIKTPEALSEEQQIERVQIAVDLLEKRGDLDSAVRYLTELLRTWKGQARLVAGPYLRLAQLEVKQGKSDAAITSLKKIDDLMVDSKDVPESVHAKSLELMAKLSQEKGDNEGAIAAYEKLLNLYEDKRALPAMRYKLGQIYFTKGEVKKAAEVWNKLETPKTEFWYNLAQEQLKNSEWHGNYKKYIQRIPAMSQQ
jgi:tetratricopeptide (TPR) repeat protein